MQLFTPVGGAEASGVHVPPASAKPGGSKHKNNKTIQSRSGRKTDLYIMRNWFGVKGLWAAIKKQSVSENNACWQGCSYHENT
jgi:hypothetical protein